MSNAANISRRNLVKGGVLAALGAASFAPVALAAEGAWDAEYDAVVLGMGGAGDMAALELAVRQGKRVCLLEALETPVSSSHLCGGDVVFCETEMEPGSADELFADLVTAAQGDCQEDLLRSYVEAAPGVYQTLKDYGVNFYKTDAPICCQAPLRAPPAPATRPG